MQSCTIKLEQCSAERWRDVCRLRTEVTFSRYKAAIYVFLVNSIFGSLAKVLHGLFSRVTEVIRCLLKHVVLQREEVRHRVFHLLNKMIQKNLKISFFSTKWITLKNFIWKKRLINIGSKHCFNGTLADLE